LADPLLRIEGLSVERGGRRVLSDLTFDLCAGETLQVSGRNGAGKSTLLRTLSGLLAPVAGTIRYGAASEETRGVETIHYLGYEDALKATLTVEENLDFWAIMLATRGAAGGATVAAALEAWGLVPLRHLPAGYLSAGQKRRVALARLLLAARPIWLLDEPLIALDATAQVRAAALMARHVEAGGAVLVASHQPLAATRQLSLDP
jgi:heme exporter protein A